MVSHGGKKKKAKRKKKKMEERRKKKEERKDELKKTSIQKLRRCKSIGGNFLHSKRWPATHERGT